MYKDDVTKINGNHVIQFGGNYQRNFDYHARNDNGQGINTSPVYQIVNGSGIQYSADTIIRPVCPSSQVGNLEQVLFRDSGHRQSAAAALHPQRRPTSR